MESGFTYNGRVTGADPLAGCYVVTDPDGRSMWLGGSSTNSPEAAAEHAADLAAKAADYLRRARAYEALAAGMAAERQAEADRARAQRAERAAATRRRNRENRPAWMA